MSIMKADRRVWASARTLADLGELTAQWLEGRIASVPGYCGVPAEETVPLIPVLARLNRAGFVTDTSQPGEAGTGYDGSWREQLAAVQGYAAQALALTLGKAALDAGLTAVIYSGPSRWRYGYARSVTVTRVNGRHFTGFGVRIPRRHLRDSHLGYGMCGREAVDALEAAWQVTVIDLEWGRPDLLWHVLGQAISPAVPCDTMSRP